MFSLDINDWELPPNHLLKPIDNHTVLCTSKRSLSIQGVDNVEPPHKRTRFTDSHSMAPPLKHQLPDYTLAVSDQSECIQSNTNTTDQSTQTKHTIEYTQHQSPQDQQV